MKKYVLIGGLCVGKSTLLAELQKMGFYIVPEAVTDIIERESKKKDGILPWTHLGDFEKEVINTQLDWENKIPNGIEAFLDRGVIDNLAYMKINKMEKPKEFIEAAEKVKYDKIFLVEPYAGYKRTDVRREDPELAKRIHQEIKKAYLSFEYNPIIVPSSDKNTRMKVLIEGIKK